MAKTKLERLFNNVTTYCSDVYVADYTEDANRRSKGLSKAQRKLLKRGVYIQDAPFNDIAFFLLQNPHKKEIYSVNFEHNKGFFPTGNRDCECMLRIKGVAKGWVLLCELKYCLETNVDVNAASAYDQLVKTWKLLLSKKVFSARQHLKVYFNISMPELNINDSFASFILSQDEVLDWLTNNKIHLLGVNDMLVVNEGILQTTQIQI